MKPSTKMGELTIRYNTVSLTEQTICRICGKKHNILKIEQTGVLYYECHNDPSPEAPKYPWLVFVAIEAKRAIDA